MARTDRISVQALVDENIRRLAAKDPPDGELRVSSDAGREAGGCEKQTLPQFIQTNIN